MKTQLKRFLFLVMLLTVVFYTAKAQTPVSGGIYANTTWTAALSPYIVTDTVVVFPGVTLTIEPGVVVKFNNNARLEIRQSSLISQGTATDSITFTSNAASPIPRIWNGIFLVGGNLTSKFNYCNFFYADTSFYSFDYNSTTVIIKNSNFWYNGIGIGYPHNIDLLVDSCNFRNNFSGIDAYYSKIRLTNSIITNNQNGILSPQGGTFIHCIIDSNSVVGILTQGEDSIINCEIKYNGIGLYDTWNSYHNFFFQNTIENNNIGIKMNFQYGIVNIYQNLYCNKICNNTTYDLYNNSTYNISMANNYWCTTDSATIASHIYDGYDNANLGLINFMPIDTSQCYLNSCNLTVTTTVTNAFCDTCHNGSATGHVANGISPYAWAWNTSPLQTTQTATGMAPGTYTLCVTDGLGCTACNNAILTGCNLIVTATVTNATCDTCPNGSATGYVTNGFPPYTWTWYTSPLQTTQTVAGMASGTYTLCVTDGYGCTACNNAIYIDSTNCTGFSISAFATNATCSSCNDGTAWVNVNGGTPPFSYTWYTVPMQATDTATGLPHGTYQVCVTDVYGCTLCDSAIVSTGNCSAYFYLYPDTTTLHHYYAVNMASGVLPISYYWAWDDGTHDTTAYPSHTYSTAGFYSICLTITDSVGCTDIHCDSFYLQKNTNTILTVDVIPNTITGINGNYSDNSFFIYPNPASDYLIIKFTTNTSKATIKIYNLLGELKSTSMISLPESKINISDLPNGVYIIEAATEKNIMRQKFIKRN